LCEICCCQITAFEQRLENSPFVEQARRVWKILHAEIYHFYAERVVLVVHAGVGDQKVEFFVTRANNGSLLEGCKRLVGLRVADIGLRQEIVNGGRGMRSAAESAEDGDRFFELIGCGVTEREIEVRGEFIGDAALSNEEMRNGFVKMALAREVRSDAEFVICVGGCAGGVGGRLDLRLLPA